MSPLCRTVSQTGLSSLKLTDDTYIGGVDTICRDGSIVTQKLPICKVFLGFNLQKIRKADKKTQHTRRHAAKYVYEED